MNTAVLVSGGVDSTVALRLLQQEGGHKLTAFYLKIWLEDELSFLGTCPWEEDLRYVEAVCAQAGVPLEVISLQKEYWDDVVSYTISEVKAGRTPNPDILCNQRIKFGAFLKKIDTSFDKVATGHYAQTQPAEDGRIGLFKAPDPIKDQTYFLSHLSQQQIDRALFPIGHLAKPEVRALAAQFDVPNKERKDSQGICFLGKLKFSEFIKYHIGEKPGKLVESETGRILGEHKGFWFYTVGQRSGIGLSGGPWYVVAKDAEANIVFISKAYYAEDKIRDRFDITQCNWLTSQEMLTQNFLRVKLRHGPHEYVCQLKRVADDRYTCILDGRDQGIAPGQFAVFYADERCLGGGVIAK